MSGRLLDCQLPGRYSLPRLPLPGAVPAACLIRGKTMFGSAALDVAIGLVLVFLLFSLVVSKINETATSLLSTRHAGLRKGLEALLGDGSDNSVLSADTVLGHALVTPIQAAAKSNLGTRVRNMFGRAQGI